MILPKDFQPVAYFSSEFATDNELPTYAGGLGVLAGDYMNACAQKDYQAIGIGILYKGINFIQHINQEGKEEKRDSQFDHDTSFLRPTEIKGSPLVIKIPSPDGTILIKPYHLRLGDQTLQFFLSTDVDGNPHHWRQDMNTLYAGDESSQIRQQIVLGIGGMRLLESLKIRPKIHHLNEGRPAMAIWEILGKMNRTQIFESNWKEASKHFVYTNHTLVAAGNPTYDLENIKHWTQSIADSLGLDINQLLSYGIKNGRFSITDYALKASSKQNAVSKSHAKFCRKNYPNYKWQCITNGVDFLRWQDSDFRKPNLNEKQIWDLHFAKKKELARSVEQRTGIGYDPNRLVVSWARRLAEYKQPMAIFQDIQRLKSIVTRQNRQVQILFAGNSHSASSGAKKLIDELIKIFSQELAGHAIFVPNYNISLANHLVSGSDVWLNTPKGNLEACGTSGMKACANGVLQCTVLDGWTYEVDWSEAGWVLDPESVAQDFYKYLETDIVPEYYERNEEGIPIRWVERMKRSILIAKNFSAERMLTEYDKKMY